MLSFLPIKFRLFLLAGVPVVGALVLSYLVARDADLRLASARALGSIEDLAHLAKAINATVDSVQKERTASTLVVGEGGEVAGSVAAERAEVDKAVADLNAFLSGRDMKQLPPRLAEGLESARQRLIKLPEIRHAIAAKEGRLEEDIAPLDAIDADLVGATAALAGLSNDGEMLRNISGLVTVMQLQERASQEWALLGYVFAQKEYPPGGYKTLVNLVTEQSLLDQVLRQSTSEDLVKMYDGDLKGPEIERAAQLRKVALDTLDDNFGVEAREWNKVQGEKIQILSRLAERLNQRVKQAALAKIGEASHAVKVSQALSGGVLFCSILLALVISLGINRAVKSLVHAAHEVQTKKDFHVRAKKVSNDELGKLTVAFNEMLDGIQARDEELEGHRVNLEALVDARTAELAKRNSAMRLVLDNVEQGLATIKPDGSLDAERSATFNSWFAPSATTNSFAEIVASNDNNAASMLQLGWDGVVEGFLPREIAIDQIPRRLDRDGRHYQLSYKLMGSDEYLDGALLMVTDITSEVERRQKESEQRELISVFEAVMKDKTGFIEFFNDAERMMEQVVEARESDLVIVKRLIHTIKGNTGIFGVHSVATACHDVESACIAEERSPSVEEREQLAKVWGAFAERVRLFANEAEADIIEVQYSELEQLLAAVRLRASHEQLTRLLESLRNEPTAVRFHRIGEQAKQLAKRMGKPEIQVQLETNDLRLPADRWGDFWSSFIHVVRNALDHGVEAEAERVAAGKSPAGNIKLTSKIDGPNYVIEISDDGRGINWNKLAEKAKQSGMPHETRQALVEALFADGVSTRETADEMSGRGVGMSAVRQACRALHGDISVVSVQNLGTTFRFTIPVNGNDGRRALSMRPGARPSIRPATRPRPRNKAIGES